MTSPVRVLWRCAIWAGRTIRLRFKKASATADYSVTDRADQAVEAAGKVIWRKFHRRCSGRQLAAQHRSPPPGKAQEGQGSCGNERGSAAREERRKERRRRAYKAVPCIFVCEMFRPAEMAAPGCAGTSSAPVSSRRDWPPARGRILERIASGRRDRICCST